MESKVKKKSPIICNWSVAPGKNSPARHLRFQTVLYNSTSPFKHSKINGTQKQSNRWPKNSDPVTLSKGSEVGFLGSWVRNGGRNRLQTIGGGGVRRHGLVLRCDSLRSHFGPSSPSSSFFERLLDSAFPMRRRFICCIYHPLRSHSTRKLLFPSSAFLWFHIFLIVLKHGGARI